MNMPSPHDYSDVKPFFSDRKILTGREKNTVWLTNYDDGPLNSGKNGRTFLEERLLPKYKRLTNGQMINDDDLAPGQEGFFFL